MLFYYELNLSCDLLFGRLPDKPSLLEEYLQDVQTWFEDIHNFSFDRIHLAKEQMKARYDINATRYKLCEGDKVWLWNLV